MGEEFAFVFDIVIIVLVVIFAFVGLKRGFAKVVLGLVSIAAAFAAAMLLSQPIAEVIYKNTIEKAVEEQFEKEENKALGELSFGALSGVDYEKVKINGVLAGDAELDYAGTRKAPVDLSELDVSETGITKTDLMKLGIAEDDELSELNAKTMEISMDDAEKYGLGKIAVAQYIAVNIAEKPFMQGFNSVVQNVGKYIPALSGGSSENAGVLAVRTVALEMLHLNTNLKTALVDGIIEPNCMMFIRTAVFALIFILVNVLLRILMTAAKLINKIPVLGKVNAFLGLILGLCEGLLAVFVICVITRMVVSVCGPNTMIFNQSVIDATFLFKTFYNFDFLNFLK